MWLYGQPWLASKRIVACLEFSDAHTSNFEQLILHCLNLFLAIYRILIERFRNASLIDISAITKFVN